MKHLFTPSEYVVSLKTGQSISVWADAVTGFYEPHELPVVSFGCLVEADNNEQATLKISLSGWQDQPQQVEVVVAEIPRELIADISGA